MKLELKHLAPYLPYGLTVLYQDTVSDFYEIEMIGLENGFVIDDNTSYGFGDVKPILRPLSDLTKEIECDGSKFYPIGKLHNSSYRRNGKTCKGEYELTEEVRNIITTKKHSFAHGVKIDLNKLDNNESWIINYLLKWHFDVFGLIEEGLAIDINTLKQ